MNAWLSWIIKHRRWLKCEYCEKVFHPRELVESEGKCFLPLHQCAFFLERDWPEELTLPVLASETDSALAPMAGKANPIFEKVEAAVVMDCLKAAMAGTVGFAKVCEMAECKPWGTVPAVDYCQACDRFLCSYHLQNHGH